MFRAISVGLYGTQARHKEVRNDFVTYIWDRVDQLNMTGMELQRLHDLCDYGVRMTSSEMREVPYVFKHNLEIYRAENGGIYPAITYKSNKQRTSKLRVYQTIIDKKAYYDAIVEWLPEE
jgi:hypothetical protein